MPHGIPFGPSRRSFLQFLSTGAAAALVSPRVLAGSSQSVYPELTKLLANHKKVGMISPQKTYRMMEWEFQVPPEAKFNINLEAALQASQEAGAESIMFYSQDCWGYAFYPTQVSVRHPNLTFDLYGKEVELAHAKGISAVTYYSLQFNHQIVHSHPDWGWVNQEGKQQKLRWPIVCLDSPYRQIVLGMMEEIFSHYPSDMLFLDSFGIQFWMYHSQGLDPFCFCRYTEEAWNQDHPGDPYREGFKTREGWERRYQWHQRRTTNEMLDAILAIARKHRPGIPLSLNGGPEQFPNSIMQKVSYIYNEPVTTNTGISLGSILARGWGRPDYQAGVFTQFGYVDKYPGVVPRVQADALIVQNARTFFVGNAPVLSDIDGQGYSTRWFKVAKEAWEDVRQVDGLLEGLEPVYSTAMLYSETTREELDRQKRPLDFRQSATGALETLVYAGRPVESIPEIRLSGPLLEQFDSLVLPEVDVLSDSHVALIREWVRKGGTLVASYKCGLLDEHFQPRSNFPLADVLGVDLVSEERKYAYDQDGKFKEGMVAVYLESAGHPLAKPISDGTVGLPGSFLKLRRTTAEEVMRFRLPVMVEDLPKDKWFNWGAPPPGTETAGPGAVYNKFGQGRALYIGAPVFRAIHSATGWGITDRPFWIREWIPSLMQQLDPNPIAELIPVPFTEYVHGTFFYAKSKRFILVQILNAVELATKGKYSGSSGVELWLDSDRLKLTGAETVWPQKQTLEIQSRGGRTRIFIPSVDRYMALYLSLA